MVLNMIRKMGVVFVLVLTSVWVVAAEEESSTVSYTLTRQYGSVFFRVMQQSYLNLVGRFDD